jgi:hypothetical protein
MIGVSSGAVWTASLVLLASAAVGSYLGYSRALAAPGGSADSDTYVTPLQAKKATAVDAAAPPPVDEAYIRKIAHDEAMAIVHPPATAPKKVRVVADSDDSDDDDSDDDKPVPGSAPAPTPSTVAATPPPAQAAPAKPPPPPTGLY